VTSPDRFESASGEALYLQVANVLKDEIVSGIYPIGSSLPSEGELCQRFSVSRYTVREGLRQLRQSGLVVSRQGSGTTVATDAASHSYVHEVTSITELSTFVKDMRFDIESMTTVTTDGLLVGQIGGAVGDRWLKVCGRRTVGQDESPICWSEIFINAEFAAVGRLLRGNRGPIFQLIEDLFGERVSEVHQEITACTVASAIAAKLEILAGSVAVQVQRTYQLSSRKTALVAVNTHPANRFRHSMTLRRVSGEARLTYHIEASGPDKERR